MCSIIHFSPLPSTYLSNQQIYSKILFSKNIIRNTSQKLCMPFSEGITLILLWDIGYNGVMEIMAIYFGLLAWIYFYVKEYDNLTKPSHRFLVRLSGYSLVAFAFLSFGVSIYLITN